MDLWGYHGISEYCLDSDVETSSTPKLSIPAAQQQAVTYEQFQALPSRAFKLQTLMSYAFDADTTKILQF